MVRKIIVGQLVDKRPETTCLYSLEDCRQGFAVEVNLVLRYRMRPNRPFRHLPYKEDVDQVACALLCSQIGVKLFGGGTIRSVVIDDSYAAALSAFRASSKSAANAADCLISERFKYQYREKAQIPTHSTKKMMVPNFPKLGSPSFSHFPTS
jgi:hypothetical protein